MGRTNQPLWQCINAQLLPFCVGCDIMKKTFRKVKMLYMEAKVYTVIRIEGEYAYLRADDAPEDEALFIAMALLPAEVDVGTRLQYEMFSYTIIE